MKKILFIATLLASWLPFCTAHAADVEISTVEQLKAFRDAVNSGTRYTGETVVLTADLDLSEEANWKPIGNLVSYPGQSFNGVFDGQNHTISNLTVYDNTPKYAVAGLFGSVEYGTIKNLTVKNVNIKSTHYAAGIVAYTSNEPSIINCHVIGGTISSTPEIVDGSYDNGDKVGGIMGYATKGSTITNCSVKDVTITAYRDMGGIVGFSAGTVTNNTVTNVTVTQDLTNGYKNPAPTTFGDVIGRNGEGVTLSGNEVVKSNGVAQIGDTKYETLQAAFNAAHDGDVVLLLGDYDAASEAMAGGMRQFVINKSFTLDGQGHTVTTKDRGFGVGNVNGDVDSKINVTFKDITIENMASGARCIDTRGMIGSLTLDGVTLKTDGASGGYTQPLTIGGNQSEIATVNITNSTIQTNEAGTAYYAIITFNPVNMTIEGSTIKGWACIYAKGEDSSAGSAGSTFNIDNCTLVSTNAYSGESNSFGAFVLEDNNVTINVTNSNITLNNTGDQIQAIVAPQDNNVTGSVSLGEGNNVTFEGSGQCAFELNSTNSLEVSGGTFNVEVPEEFCADGYIPEDNGDGTYGVKVGTYVAQIGTTKYETLQEALDAAEAEDTPNIVINLLNDATLDITAWDGAKNPLSIGTANTLSITINGNAHTLTFNQKNSDWNNVATMNDAQTKLILNNMYITNSGYNNGPWNRHDINFNCAVELNDVTSDKALAFKNNATLNNVTVNDASGDIYAIWVSPRTEGGQTISINGLDVTCGRGIKVDDQYVDAPVSTTLEIENATFTTSKKSAILVKTAGGADITVGENVNIEHVAADPNNLVWVDEDRADEYYNVTVTVTGTGTGANLIPEGGEVSYVASLVRGEQTRGYYATFAAAYNSTDFEEGDTYKLLKNTTETVEVAKALTIVKNGFTAANLTAAKGFNKTETDEAITFVAVDPVCEIAGVQYYTLAEAVAAVPTDGTQTTITMIDNETVNVSGYAIVVAQNQNIVLDLNGYQVVGVCDEASASSLIRNIGTLTIKDSSDTNADGTGNGKLTYNPSVSWTYSEADPGGYASDLIRNEGTLVVESGCLENKGTGSATYAIDSFTAGNITINGGKIDTAKSSAIRLFYNNGGSLTVNDGVIGHYTSDDDCSYMGIQLQAGTNATVSVNGGVIDGYWALYASNTGGAINISGGTYGFVGFGSAVPSNIISITDGTIYEVYVYGSQTGFISGGTFAEPVDEAFCAEGYIPTDNGDGTYGVKLGTYVAQIGEEKFETLEAAFAAATDGQTITLLANCAGNGIQVAQGKYNTTGLTVDFAGFTYTINGATVGSTGTKTQAFQLQKNNTIVFRNGTIIADNVDVKMMIQNYSNLTLDGMTLDATQGTNSVGYVLSTNNGTTVINNTTITAKSTGIAFDVDSGWGNYASNSVEVTGTSVINGNIEVAFEGKTEGTPSVLTLTSGTLNGNIVMGTGAEKATVTKADDLDVAAPEGYIWQSNGDGTSKLDMPTVSVGSKGFATLSSIYALDFTNVENIYAYIAVVENGKVAYKRIRKVPANTGLLLRNPEETSATAKVPVLASTETAESTEGNRFVAVSETIASLATAGDGVTNYILNSNGVNGPGFYQANGKKVAAGKAYLALDKATHVKALVFDEDDATGIAEVESFDEGTQATYNLAGQRVPARSAQKGIYIVNGKKIIK